MCIRTQLACKFNAFFFNRKIKQGKMCVLLSIYSIKARNAGVLRSPASLKLRCLVLRLNQFDAAFYEVAESFSLEHSVLKKSEVDELMNHFVVLCIG